jgi:hypothetical protein
MLPHCLRRPPPAEEASVGSGPPGGATDLPSPSVSCSPKPPKSPSPRSPPSFHPTIHTHTTSQALATDRHVADVEAAGGVAGVAAKLGTSTSAGLPPGMVPTLRACFGDNRLPPKRRKWWLEHFAESITDLTLMILMAGAIITIAFGATTDRQEDQITGALSFPPFPTRTPSDSSPLPSPSSSDSPASLPMYHTPACACIIPRSPFDARSSPP